MKLARSGRVASSRGPLRPCMSRQYRLTVEPLEGRIVLDGGRADIAMLSATTTDSRSVTFRYELTLPGAASSVTAEVAFFRSIDREFSESDVPFNTPQEVQLAAGEHAVTVSLSETLAIDPSHPYVLAVAHLPGGIDESDEWNNTASFRIFTIGAVSHGFELSPGDSVWVDVMARSLEQLEPFGYDLAIPFHWDALSAQPIPGMTTLAGLRLADAVTSAVESLATNPGDVIALHLIGHSRGSVVISQAAQTLQFLEQVSPELAPLKAGPLKMTFLDPHPANNTYTGTLYSAAPNLLGQIGTSLYHSTQSAMEDPNVVVPASADWAEVYFQRTSYTRAVTPTEQFFLIWGQNAGDIDIRAPLTTVVTSYDLTNTVPGHYLVHDWYQENVVPTLGAPSSLSLAGAAVSMTSVMATPEPSVVILHRAHPEGPLAILDRSSRGDDGEYL